MARTKQMRRSYEAAFKLRVVAHAEAINNNKATGRHFGIPEKSVREWRKEKIVLEQMPKTRKTLRGRKPSNPELEKVLADWIIKCRQNGINVTKHKIRSRAVKLLNESTSSKESTTSTMSASNSWCTRFLQRHSLKLRKRKTVVQEQTETVEEKFDSKAHNCDLSQTSDTCENVTKQKRRLYGVAFKLRVVAYAEAVNNNNATGRHFGIPEKSVREWVKQKKVLEQMPKTKKTLRGGKPSNPKLEKVLADWIIRCRQNGINVTRDEVRSRADKLLNLSTSNKGSTTSTKTASNGWCTRFLLRHNLKLKRKKRKQPDTAEEKFHPVAHNYDLSQIDNMSEYVMALDLLGNHSGIIDLPETAWVKQELSADELNFIYDAESSSLARPYGCAICDEMFQIQEEFRKHCYNHGRTPPLKIFANMF